MTRLSESANPRVRSSLWRLAGAALFSLSLAGVSPAAARAQPAAETTAARSETRTRTDTKTAAKPDSKGAQAPEKGSVTDNVKELGREAKDPGTLQRIKAHEQELEKRIERRRDRQRKDHGEARPSDAVDLAKNLDKTDDAAAAPVKASPNPKARPKDKNGAKDNSGAVTPP